MEQKIEKLISDIENNGCVCEIDIGWTCSIHEQIKELRKLLKVGEK